MKAILFLSSLHGIDNCVFLRHRKINLKITILNKVLLQYHFEKTETMLTTENLKKIHLKPFFSQTERGIKPFCQRTLFGKLHIVCKILHSKLNAPP